VVTLLLGNNLLQVFGFIPEAFRKNPTGSVQCPEPGQPKTAHKGKPGTCTIHTTRDDLGPVLAKMGKEPAKTNVFVPSINHSHILDETEKPAVWWQVLSGTRDGSQRGRERREH
jgi:hypothetical protein